MVAVLKVLLSDGFQCEHLVTSNRGTMRSAHRSLSPVSKLCTLTPPPFRSLFGHIGPLACPASPPAPAPAPLVAPVAVPVAAPVTTKAQQGASVGDRLGCAVIIGACGGNVLPPVAAPVAFSYLPTYLLNTGRPGKSYLPTICYLRYRAT